VAVVQPGCVSGAWHQNKIEVSLVRKKTDLEMKFDAFVENRFWHLCKEVAFIKGELKILLILVSCLTAGILGVLVNEVLQ
tara:strand:- start:382 stop:621 length:240 start_codon:yes stop_codon:yes gene_type:complete